LREAGLATLGHEFKFGKVRSAARSRRAVPARSLTGLSRGRAQAGFAHLFTPLTFNVGRHALGSTFAQRRLSFRRWIKSIVWATRPSAGSGRSGSHEVETARCKIWIASAKFGSYEPDALRQECRGTQRGWSGMDELNEWSEPGAVIALGRPSCGGRRAGVLALGRRAEPGCAVAETLLPPNTTFKRTCLRQAA